MELKSRNPCACKCSVLRSNRTFMELKLEHIYMKQYETVVLIVPLWN